MKKRLISSFQYLSGIIIILLIFATFFLQKENPETFSQNIFVKFFALDHFYDSYPNTILFSAMILLIFLSIIFRALKKKTAVMLHIIIALAFIVIIFDKSVNSQFTVPIREETEINFGEVVNNETDKYNINLYLEKFQIIHHPNSSMPKSFTSFLILDKQDTVKISVNKPLKLGKYRLYQSAYHKIPLYEVNIIDKNYKLFLGDSAIYNNNKISIEKYPPNPEKFIFRLNNEFVLLNTDKSELNINNLPVKVALLDTKFVSIIEVAEKTGMKLLLLLGLAYLFVLGIVFWGKNK